MLMIEHRTPQGLEIRMFGREARRNFLGMLVNKGDRDETEEELQARFARVLRETNFQAIAVVFAVEKKEEAASPPARKNKRRAVMPPLVLKEKDEAPIPSFLGPKK